MTVNAPPVPAATGGRLAPHLPGVSRWRVLLFTGAALLVALFHALGIGGWYWTSSWFMSDPTAIESRVHGAALGARHLFGLAAAAVLLSRWPHRHAALMWLMVVGAVLAELAILASLGTALPQESRTNAVANATSIPLPSLLLFAAYPGKRALLLRASSAARTRVPVACLTGLAAAAAAVALLDEQRDAVLGDAFVASQPRLAETASALVAVVVGCAVVAIGVRGWQPAAAVTGVVAGSTGMASLLFPDDRGALPSAGAVLLVVGGAALLVLAFWHRRRQADADVLL